MSHLLPSHSHPAREMFEVTDLVAVSNGEMPVHCTIAGARRSAVETLRHNPAARRIVMFNVDASNDQLRLVSFGRRGGHKVEWVFGPITRATRLI